MDVIIIKIESEYMSLAQTKKAGGKEYISLTHRTELPEILRGEDITAHPEELANFIVSSIMDGGMTANRLALYFGSNIERFAEFKFSDGLGKEAIAKRREQAERSLLEDRADTPFRVRHYNYPVKDRGLIASAIFAASAEFCDRLTDTLARTGYQVIALSSSLTAFAEIASLFSDIGERVLAVNAEKHEICTALFEDNNLSDMKRFSQGVESGELADFLRPLITDKTKVVLCGDFAQDRTFLRKLKEAGTVAAGPVSPMLTGISENIVLTGELAGQDANLPGIFPSLAFAEGAPPPFMRQPLSYLSKGSGAKRQYIGLIAVCAAVLAVAIFICSVPPVMLAKAEREHAENTERLEEPFFAGAAQSLVLYRNLVSEYSELTKMEEVIEVSDPSYAQVLSELKENLLMAADIDEMFYEKGHGIFVDFTTSEAEIFDQAKNYLNDTRRMSIYETSEREEIAEDEWRIQIRITLTPSAWEEPK